jgi:hypothetical protein
VILGGGVSSMALKGRLAAQIGLEHEIVTE